jgi:hypothetical protein
MRLEAHLTRQLTMTLDLLAQLRGQREGGTEFGALIRQVTDGLPLSLPVGKMGSFRNGHVGANGADLATVGLGD